MRFGNCTIFYVELEYVKNENLSKVWGIRITSLCTGSLKTKLAFVLSRMKWNRVVGWVVGCYFRSNLVFYGCVWRPFSLSHPPLPNQYPDILKQVTLLYSVFARVFF